jgi:hypothetical protein
MLKLLLLKVFTKIVDKFSSGMKIALCNLLLKNNRRQLVRANRPDVYKIRGSIMFSGFISKSFFFASVVVGVFFLFFPGTASALSDQDPFFTHIDVKPVASHKGFVNSRRYSLSYYVKTETDSYIPQPTLEQKRRDYDLILAAAVRQFIEDEYFKQFKGMDEHVIDDADKGTILDLVNRDFLSKAWKDEQVNVLRQFIDRNQNNMMLFTMNVYLDYKMSDGKYNYGNDINPVLLRFNPDPDGNDEVTFIVVNYSDK